MFNYNNFYLINYCKINIGRYIIIYKWLGVQNTEWKTKIDSKFTMSTMKNNVVSNYLKKKSFFYSGRNYIIFIFKHIYGT